jgi:hypothetical protein
MKKVYEPEIEKKPPQWSHKKGTWSKKIQVPLVLKASRFREAFFLL